MVRHCCSRSCVSIRRWGCSTPVRRGRVMPLRYEALTPGPANIDAIEQLARALHPDAFGW